MPGLVKRRASGMIMGNALRDLRRAVEVPTDDDEAGDPPVEHETPDDETPDETLRVDARARTDTCRIPTRSPSTTRAPRQRPLPPPSILESVLTELLGAVPEVKDHVLEAADALLDAAKALIEAADRVICQQRGGE